MQVPKKQGTRLDIIVAKEEGSAQDLSIAGTMFADGSLMAQSIRIGLLDGEFTRVSTTPVDQPVDFAGGELQGGYRGNLQRGQNSAEFQNLTPEERQARFAQMRQTGAEILFGEIIARDEALITIKLKDGGSRLVLYSDATHIVKQSGADIEDEKTQIDTSI